MHTYNIYTKHGIMTIEADQMAWSANGLKFFVEEKCVAFFIEWDHWILIK